MSKFKVARGGICHVCPRRLSASICEDSESDREAPGRAAERPGLKLFFSPNLKKKKKTFILRYFPFSYSFYLLFHFLIPKRSKREKKMRIRIIIFMIKGEKGRKKLRLSE